MPVEYFIKSKNTLHFSIFYINHNISVFIPLEGDYGRLFELSGSQSKDWVKTQAYIGRRKAPFFLNFTAISAGGSRGDIAIDEINFKNCAPPPTCGAGGSNDTGSYVYVLSFVYTLPNMFYPFIPFFF